MADNWVPPRPFELWYWVNGVPVHNTYSWCFLPLIAIALGRGNQYPSMQVHVLHTPGLMAICLQLGLAFALAGYTANIVYAHGNYLSPDIQNHLLSLPFGQGQAAGQAAQLYAVSIVNDSILAYQAQPPLMLPFAPDLMVTDQVS